MTDPPATRPTLDEASRPAGPLPTVDVRAAVGMGAHLVEVHDWFRADLDQLRAALQPTASGEIEFGVARTRLATVSRRALGGLCRGYCRMLEHHHLLESQAVFPHLRRHADGLGAVLDRLDEEHGVIHALLSDVDAALLTLADDPSALEPVSAAVDRLSVAVLSHFGYEERELVEPLTRYGMYAGPR